MISGYREFLPNAALEPFVECFWAHGTPQARVCVLPDTCVDIVFSPARGLEIVGTMTRPLFVPAANNACVGVRFHAAKFRACVNAPLHELTDKSVRLEDISRDGRAREEQLRNARSCEQMVHILRSHIAPIRTISSLQNAIAYLVKHAGHVSIAEICRLSGLSARQFRRRCLEETGVTPKHLARISRFRQACLQIIADRKTDWATLALDSGYYDQAHFIHDFEEFSGRTPVAYLAQRAA